MQKIVGLVRRCVDDYHMIEAGDKIAVGVSGGKDSLTLLVLLRELQRYYPKSFSLAAVTIDMGLGGMDFSTVQALCDRLEVPFTKIKTEIGPIIFEYRQEKNPCSMCAKMRRGALNEALLSQGIHKIALGHHHDDAVETFLMSLPHQLLPAGDPAGPHGHHPDPTHALSAGADGGACGRAAGPAGGA